MNAPDLAISDLRVSGERPKKSKQGSKQGKGQKGKKKQGARPNEEELMPEAIKEIEQRNVGNNEK